MRQNAASLVPAMVAHVWNTFCRIVVTHAPLELRSSPSGACVIVGYQYCIRPASMEKDVWQKLTKSQRKFPDNMTDLKDLLGEFQTETDRASAYRRSCLPD